VGATDKQLVWRRRVNNMDGVSGKQSGKVSEFVYLIDYKAPINV